MSPIRVFSAALLLSRWLAGPALAAGPAAPALPESRAANAATATTAPRGFAGLSADRVDEPVFNATVVIYHGGESGADPVVLVHGLGQNGARDWSALVPDLIRTHREVFAIDLPGFAQSAHGDQAYTPENYIKVIEKVLAPRVGRPFTLIGHSMGGAVSLGYAAAYPQRVKRLVLVDMAGVLAGAVYADYLARGMLGSKGVPGGMLDSMLGRVLGKMEGMPVDRDAIVRTPALRQQFLRGDPNAIAGFALGQHDFSEALRSIAAPTLLIWGASDPVAPLRTGQMAASIIPGARLAVLPGVGHVPMAQDTARFNALVLDELAERTALAPYAATFPAEPAGTAQHCDGKDGMKYSGDIARLTLIQCTNVEVSHARIGELRVLESGVKLVDVQVREGLYALRSKLELTAGSVAGSPALSLDQSDVDAAGTRFEPVGPVADNRGQAPITLRLSVTEVRRANQAPRYFHDFVNIAPGKGW